MFRVVFAGPSESDTNLWSKRRVEGVFEFSQLSRDGKTFSDITKKSSLDQFFRVEPKGV